GADAGEGRLPEVQQAGVPELDIQADRGEREHHHSRTQRLAEGLGQDQIDIHRLRLTRSGPGGRAALAGAPAAPRSAMPARSRTSVRSAPTTWRPGSVLPP